MTFKKKYIPTVKDNTPYMFIIMIPLDNSLPDMCRNKRYISNYECALGKKQRDICHNSSFKAKTRLCYL